MANRGVARIDCTVPPVLGKKIVTFNSFSLNRRELRTMLSTAVFEVPKLFRRMTDPANSKAFVDDQ